MGQTRVLDWNCYSETAIQAVAEGVVLLRNEKKALPLQRGEKVAVFGRIQLNYYKSGTGSGGMVNVSRVVGITDALIESGAVEVNQNLLSVYRAWCEQNPFDLGNGWGTEPWSQKEMVLSEELCAKTAQESETAIVIIGRTAGEDQDNRDEKGAYRLSDEEEAMLATVRKQFSKMVVLLNVGGLFDMSFVTTYAPEAVAYVWHGGMLGGIGTAQVLTGEKSPSGKLPDTIAYAIEDYPSHANFGDLKRNVYAEDIYVGYRYFETFAKDKVMYPFGFGLSYTTFAMEAKAVTVTRETVTLEVSVTNTGAVAGKEVVQVYCEAPQGLLGKPARVLCAFEKTKELAPGETQTLTVTIAVSELASFDDLGKTGHKSCFVLEAGEYVFYVGSDVRSATKAAATVAPGLVVVKECTQVLAPVMSFERMTAVSTENGVVCGKEIVPATEPKEEERRQKTLPKELSYTGDLGIRLADVAAGTATMDAFIAQLSDEELACIVRGEGMCSPKVTAGTASAFGGVTKELQNFGIPCACCADGPSGIRMDCGTKAFSMPNGTLLASTFHKELVTELFTLFGLEAAYQKVDCMLGPGLNLHRHPLNGRNFEYFSEDPYLTGTMAAAELQGFHTAGVTGTVKHFCCNDQESGRHTSDSVVSERALREIYLKCFELAVKEGRAMTIMSTYGALNGLWTAGNYDLNTSVLREEWGFDGIVMTDWWANINVRGEEENKQEFAAMVRAQNDLYMVCADSKTNEDNIMASLADGSLTRGELQRNATNICRFLMGTNAMKRLMGTEDVIEVLDCPYTEESAEDAAGEMYVVGDRVEIDLMEVACEKGTQYPFTLVIDDPADYRITITASSTAGELAQIPMTLFLMGSAFGTFTWNGTGGKPVSFARDYALSFHYTSVRLSFAQNGLKLHSMVVEKVEAIR
ncbi:MAG: glycoside hydrolase family 3 protein [Lachnospiraceae bacterium]|nr:glycoside hydrolase family 3 protein [Lachnospiraceae bacterium]